MSERISTYSIFKNTAFRRLASARFLLALAALFQTVVVGWQVYDIQRDPLYLGLVGLAEAVPAISLALIGGHIVDRRDPLRILKSMVALELAGTLLLFVFAGGWIEVSAAARLAVIFGVVVSSGVVRAFAWPAEFTILPRLVSREWLPVAATWRSTLMQTSMIMGPALGGVVYGWGGERWAYGVCSGFVLLAVWFAWRIPALPPREASAAVTPEPISRSLSAGIRFVFSNQVVLGALALDMFAVFFGGATALIPIFAGDILKSGPQSLGLLRSAPAVGALLANFLMIHRPLGRAAGRWLFAAVASYGLCMIGFGLSRTLWLSVFFLGMSGAFDSVSVVVRHTILQLWTPDDMRGRVSAVNMIFIGSSNEIGEFESGLAAKLLGTVPSVVFGGIMTVIVVLVTARLAPKLLRLELDTPKKA